MPVRMEWGRCECGLLLLSVVLIILFIPSSYQQGQGQGQGKAKQVCTAQADIVFVIDSSGSINDADPGNFNRNKQFIVDVIEALDKGPGIGEDKVRIGAVTFSNNGKKEFYLNEKFEKQNLINAVWAIHYSGGNTNTAAGLQKMHRELFVSQRGDRLSAPNTAVVITDGFSTVNNHTTIPTAVAAKKDRIRIIVVAVTDHIDMREIVGIASPAENNFRSIFAVDDFDKLTANLVTNLVSTICYEPTTIKPPSTTPALNPIKECKEQVDLIFVLDASGSIEATNFEKMKDFVRTFAEEVDIDSGLVRMGLITYSDREQLRFHLNAFKTRRQVMNAIDKIPYARGTTNTAAALRYASDTAFIQSNGDRRGAQNVLFLITDGQSNDNRRTLDEAKRIKDSGVHIFVAGIGNWLDEQELNAIASYPKQRNVFRLTDFNKLDQEFRNKMRSLVCNNDNNCQYNPCRNSVRCNDMLGYNWCTCRDGYGGQFCESRCQDNADIVFALDASGSIGRENFEKMVVFVQEVINGLGIGTPSSNRRSRVGLLTYSNNANRHFDLDAYDNKFSILNAFPPFYSGGTTNTADAIRYVRENMFVPTKGDQPGVPNLAIVMTDGKSNNEMDTWKQALQARGADIQMIAIGIGENVRQRELEAIASYPPVRNVFTVDRFNSLNNIRQKIVDSLCNNVNECESYPCRNGGTCENLINGFICRCTSSYTGTYCERRCDGAADVAFILDASGSIHRERFPVVLDFAQQIVDALEVTPEKTRVALITWSNGAYLRFNLNAYKNKQDVIQAIGYTPYIGQRTHTADALNLMMREVFTSRNGDREDVQNYAFVITDGNSNINEKETIPAAVRARVAGVHINVVSVGKQINRIELNGIASVPVKENLFEVERFQDLQTIINRMPPAICNDVNECDSYPCRNGGRCIDGLKRYICICPEGRTGNNCEITCRRQLDVVFMLDLSGSVESQYDRTLAFTKRVIYGLDMAFDRTRIGIITFGTDTAIQFDLNAYRDKQDVLNAIAFYPNRGRTNTQGALNRMRTTLFSSSRGDRSGVPNIGLLVTDGYSNVNQYNTINEATAAKNQNIAIYVVAIGDEVDMGEVTAIAGKASEPPDSYVFRVRSDGEIDRVADALSERLCQ